MTDTAQEIKLARTIYAAPSQVYSAFTSTDGWCKWCCERAEIEACIGGKLHIYTQGYNAVGEFAQLEQDRVVDFTLNGDAEPPTRIHVSIDKRAGGAQMLFRITGDWSEQDWPGFTEFLERTWGRALNNLKAVLEAGDELITWLMEGDPAIRWQVLRDLQGAPQDAWQAERQRTLSEGWGARLMGYQAADGSWGGGIYSPKWISTTYTLLQLCAIGIPGDHPPAQKAAELVLDRQLGSQCDEAFLHNLAGLDRCIVGMDLQIAAYFGIQDGRTDAIVENLLAELMPDGAWNCRRHSRPKPHHSSFHTTFNVLEGLRQWLDVSPQHALRSDVLRAEQGALELLLEHRLYKSDKTGEIINSKFTMLSYPHRWHYTVLRGLEYFARINAAHDERLLDAIDLLKHQRRADGFWEVHYKYSGKEYFEMEKLGKPSRWNTLRALRVLQWWES